MKYEPSKIEKKWQKKWAASKLYKSKEGKKQRSLPAGRQGKDKGKYYALDMFPYPSGEGLHVGHPKGYIATDIISRMRRMQGYSVLHPMGFDAFGLPAENYAIKTKTNPAVSVKKNVARYKKQLELLGFDYDWSREVNTTDPTYYKWTQWIFLQMFKKGLAYESYEPVNWCPTDKTVLANEDVENGRCERCGTLVEKKPMRQWVLKITDYADRLLDDLDATDDSKMPKVVDKVNPFQKDKKTVKRDVVHAIVFDKKTNKYLIIRNKTHDWDTVILGGIEKGEDLVGAARREVREETGYIDIEFKRILGGPVENKYYAKHKGENRIAIARAVYFELNSDKRLPIAEGEDKDNEIIWVDPADFVHGKVVNTELPIWLERLKIPEKSEASLADVKPLLDWPESIKESQRNWIGRSEGAEIDFRLEIKGEKRPRFVIIHGFEGTAHTNFIPWLKSAFEKRGYDVEAPELPNTNKPKEDEQVEYILKNCRFDENTVIIGHSLGAIVAMKAIMKLNRPVSGLVVVAAAIDPAFPDAEPRPYAKNFTWDIDYGLINKLTEGRIAVLSDTQEELRGKYLNFLSEKLDAYFKEVKAVEEHFRAPEEPAILEACTVTVPVFTTRPDTIFGVTYVVLSPEHHWVKAFLPKIDNRDEVEAYVNRSKSKTEIERTDATKEKTGVELKGLRAVNPANGEEVPVWIADYVLADYGTGAVMAVPAHDERDWDFAKKFNLPIRQVIEPIFVNKKGEDAVRPGLPFVERKAIMAIVKHWSEDKYIGLRWKKVNWQTLITGGPEGNQTPLEGAITEITEETGYLHPKLVKELGKVHAKFFHVPKQVNRFAHFDILFFQLENEERKEMSEADKANHDIFWLKPEEMDKWLEHEANIYAWKLFRNGPSVVTEDGLLINSGKFSGKDNRLVMKEITDAAGGRWVTKYKLRDWVFSRQRYWGEPIPVIHCPKCGVVAVPEKDLPVKLPRVKSYEPTGTGESPLSAIKDWVNVKCPNCKGPAKRETNTMPQWAGSSWYYLRYEDPSNKKALVDSKKEKYWSPVDMYVGGAEHATRHLIYARFWHKFLYDIGSVSYIEPFAKLQNVGLIIGQDGRKMSKRFGNVINPDDIVATYGADTLRLYEMFMGPFDQSIAWNTESIIGSRRFIERVWKLFEKVENKSQSEVIMDHAIYKVSEDIRNLRFNTAISTLMITTNLMSAEDTISRKSYEILLLLLAPFAPHVTEELWSKLGNKKSIHVSPWPEYKPSLLKDKDAVIVVQVNGKVRGSFKTAINADDKTLEEAAKALPEVKKWLDGKEIRKVIVKEGKLVSFATT